MYNNTTYQRKHNGDTFIDISLDSQPEITSSYSFSDYAKVGGAIVGTLTGAAMLASYTGSASSSWRGNGAAPDSRLNNPYQPINPQEAITFADNSLPIQPRHAKRSGFGEEFQINTYTTSWQRFSSVASLGTGEALVTWESWGQDGDNYGIYGQYYSITKIPLGSEFQINTYTSGHQMSNSVAGLSTGEALVVWESYQDGDAWGIFGQFYADNKKKASNEFQINTYTMGDQCCPAVAFSPTTDEALVVWQSNGQDGDLGGIYGQFYSSIGSPLGVEFQINTYTIGDQRYPAVAFSPITGEALVTWESGEQDGDGKGIFGQFYSSTRKKLGNEFQINTYTIGDQTLPAVAGLSTGGTLVTWQSNGQDGDLGGIFGQFYSSIRVRQGNEFQINTDTVSNQWGPSVAGLSTGEALVVWVHDASGASISGQFYSSTRVRQGNEFQVNTYITTTDYEEFPSVAGLSTGEALVTWVSNGAISDGDGYGIFGNYYFSNNAPPVLWNNALTLNKGETVILDAANFSATDPDNSASELTFTVSNVQYGQFERVSNAGVVITSFTLQEIMDGGIQFVHDGTQTSPGYAVSVSDGQYSDGPDNAIISFDSTNAPPQLVTNAFSINQGQTLVLNSGMLLASDVDNHDTQIRFLVTNVQHGQFEKIDNVGVPISEFTQEDVLTGQIQFVHDNSETAPSFDIAVTDGIITITPTSGNVVYNAVNDAPSFLGVVSLTIQEGQTITLTSANLQATDNDNVDLSLVFTVSGVTNGQFESSNNPGVAITSFTQAAVQNGEISFAHDGSSTAPSFSVIVSDGALSNSNGPQAAAIFFTPLNDAPIITVNTLTVSEGGKVILTPSNLQATDEETSVGALTFNVANVARGQFENTNNPGVPITSFTQQSIINGNIQFVHNGDAQAPGYDVTVTDGVTSSAPQAATISFTPTNDAPILVTNELTINEGETKVLSHVNIEVTDDDNPADELTITVTHVKNGFFSRVDNPKVPITSFTQEDIYDGKMQFTQRGNKKPTYTLTVTDKDGAIATDNPDSVEPVSGINFVPKATGTDSTPVTIGAVAGGVAVLAGLAVSIGLFAKHKIDENTRKQHLLARYIRSELNLKGVNNFKTEDGKKYVNVIEVDLVAALALQGIVVNEETTDDDLKGLAKDVGSAIIDKIAANIGVDTCCGKNYSVINPEDIRTHVNDIASRTCDYQNEDIEAIVEANDDDTSIELGSFN